MVDFRVHGFGEGARFAYEPTLRDSRIAALAGSVDLVLAGPPCQGHSSLNNHSRHEDPKNLLYLTVPAIAVAVGARHVVIENVPNVVADKHGVAATTIALLRDNGYGVVAGVLAADKLGWPQTRKRFFVVASRDFEPWDLNGLSESFTLDAPLPVMALLHDLEGAELDGQDVMRSVPRLSRENQERVDWLFDNSTYDLPNEERPDCHKLGTTYVATYGRMHEEAPAPTITGGFLTPGRGRFIHPTQRRVLTPREAARIQGFPDWFDFMPNPNEPPSRTEVGRWIGNAVPSILGFVATLAVLAGRERSQTGS
jgi:DNA (cytosine-5)-methyltransferase 1